MDTVGVLLADESFAVIALVPRFSVFAQVTATAGRNEELSLASKAKVCPSFEKHVCSDFDSPFAVRYLTKRCSISGAINPIASFSMNVRL